ncbi:MAG: DUF4918 family protein [Chlorobi bacterium]|nr:DUF4918 family protein [Chlorobiota bacterium]
MRTFGKSFLDWLDTLQLPVALPLGYELLEPYKKSEVRAAVTAFAERYYADANPRVGVFGINPGRFGAGLTGLSFTDPYALGKLCGIQHTLGDGREISATFVYETIEAFGGVERFYRQFYLSALVPFGFTRDGRNVNFYDEPNLERSVLPLIAEWLQQQQQFPLCREVGIILGSGKLRRIAEKLNEKHRLFDRLVVLDHPRFIMQYRRTQLRRYVEQYVRAYHDARLLCGMT